MSGMLLLPSISLEIVPLPTAGRVKNATIGRDQRHSTEEEHMFVTPLHARDGRTRFLMAEEFGLVSAIVDPGVEVTTVRGMRSMRVRLNPPEEMLREDSHVFDLDAALAFADERVVAPLSRHCPQVAWTDTVIGIGRITVSFAVPSEADLKRAKKLAASLSIDPCELEEVVVERSAAARVEDLLSLAHDAELTEQDIADEPTDAVLTAIRALPPQGLLSEKAGLGERHLDCDRVLEALRWLDGALAKIERPILDALEAPRRARLIANINAHPSVRSFGFEVQVRGGLDATIFLSPRVENALRELFDVSLDQARRLPGVIWSSSMMDAPLEEFSSRVLIDVSS